MNRSNTDANRFRLPPGARPVACVDIGGTKVAVSIADEHGLRARVEEPTAKSGSNSALADQLMRKNGNAGHGGRMFVSDNDDALCGCGNVGDLEALVAGNAIPRRFSETGFFDGAKLLTAAKDNHPQALTIVDELCLLKGCALYNLITTLDLQRISLGGSGY